MSLKYFLPLKQGRFLERVQSVTNPSLRGDQCVEGSHNYIYFPPAISISSLMSRLKEVSSGCPSYLGAPTAAFLYMLPA